MIRQKPEPKNAGSATSKQVRPNAKIPAAAVAVNEAPPSVRQHAKQTGVRGSTADADKSVPPVKPKRDRAEYMRKYRRDQLAELKRLREIVAKDKG